MINGVQPRTHSGNIIACISSYTTYPSEARKVLKFLSSEEGLQLTYDVIGKIPDLKDSSVIEGVMKDLYIAGILTQASHTDSPPTIPEMQAFWEPIETAFKAVLDGISTPEGSS